MTPLVETEAGFQAAVIELATIYGWRWRHEPTVALHRRGERRHLTVAEGNAAAGWPDLVLRHDRWQRCVFLELKGRGGRVTVEQAGWIRALAAAGLEAYIVEPRDWDLLAALLGGQARAGVLSQLRERTRARAVTGRSVGPSSPGVSGPPERPGGAARPDPARRRGGSAGPAR